MMNRPKILVLTSTFPRWIGDKEPPFVYELSRRLTQQYEVHILAPHAKGAKFYENWDGLHVHRFRYFFTTWQTLTYAGGILANLKQNKWRYFLIPFFVLFELIALLHLVKQHQFVAIHAHWLIPQGLVAVIAKRLIKLPPILLTSHGSDLHALQHPWLKNLKAYVINQSDAMTVVSHAMQLSVLEHVKKLPNNFAVVSMGVDLQYMFLPKPAVRKTNTLLYAGRLVENKGVQYLLQAFAKVLQAHPLVSLTIIGQGEYLNTLKALAEYLNINHALTFLGAREYSLMPLFYQQADIVVFPSIQAEGFGLVVVEALGCECAVIATDLPAMQDILQDKETGLIVKQKDVDELAKAIQWLLDHPELKQALGRKGREFVTAHYDWEHIKQKYIDVIEKMCMEA